MSRSLLRIIFLANIIGLLASPSFAQSERIYKFHSDISVNSDASLDVIETIQVRAAGIDIKRGIYRDFPTIYTESDGQNYTVQFDLIDVKRDGKPEGYHTENQSNGIRIYIGRREVMLAHGVYTYTIHYKTLGHIGYFDDFDELYWNVTGNGWKFPIDEASATIHMPYLIDEHNTAVSGYTGRQGSTEQSYEASVNPDGSLAFRATRSLQPYEGLTIAVSIPKGTVTEIPRTYYIAPKPAPSAPKKDYLLFFMVSAVLAYYMFSWWRVGMDPDKGVIIPLYYPPKDFTPDALRYLAKMSYDNKSFTAMVVQLAVKGVVTIEDSPLKIGPLSLGRSYTLIRNKAGSSNLTAAELALLNDIFPSSKTKLELDNKNHVQISQAISNHTQRLKKNVEKIYFFSNLDNFAWGFMISMGLATLTLFKNDTFNTMSLILSLVMIVILNVIFFRLLKAPTQQGRNVLDKIEGFKMFLTATEKEALKWLDSPQKTPQLYEDYLPYAIALDVEDKWSLQFTAILAAAAAAGYAPSWYISDRGFDSHSFGQTMGSSFSNAISSSSQAPGSSSGSGGGGSSGGGGGGGGGGGW